MDHHRRYTYKHVIVWGAWMFALPLSFGVQMAIQGYLGTATFTSYLAPIYLIMAATSIVYGYFLCRGWFCERVRYYDPIRTADGVFNDNDNDSNANDAAITTDPEQVPVQVQQPLEIEPTETGEGLTTIHAEPIGESVGQCEQTRRPGTTTTTTTTRLYFLDNIKIFLTAVVIVHHCLCAFGGCGNGWYLVVGNYPNAFQTFAKVYAMLNQTYFMSLFFFISAYFIPTSYDRKGKTEFLRDKARRLWLPAMVVSFLIVPAAFMVGMITGKATFQYIIFPGQCWFLFWLLVLMFAYSTIREASPGPQPTTDASLVPFPSIWRRLIYGALFCGLAMLAVIVVVNGNELSSSSEPITVEAVVATSSNFYSMPITVGALANDIFFFVAGVKAKRNQWLSRPLDDAQLGMPVWMLRLCAVLEAVAVVALFTLSGLFEGIVPVVVFFLIVGVFCVDVSLALLQFFQQCFNVQSPFCKFLSDAAYTVYLIHPLVITATTSAFVRVYNSQYDTGIAFEGGIVSASILHGPVNGAIHLALGWTVVTIASQAIVWPLAWCLRRLPVLREVL